MTEPSDAARNLAEKIWKHMVNAPNRWEGFAELVSECQQASDAYASDWRGLANLSKAMLEDAERECAEICKAALEEAAKLCDEKAERIDYADGAAMLYGAAAEIRALKNN